MLRNASDGGFEGHTAVALHNYVQGSLRKFMENVHNSFDLAASAVARYANALREAQGRADRAAERGGAVAIPPAGLVGKDAPPPAELTAAKHDIEAEVDFITGEAKILEDALNTACTMMSSPITPPKKSFAKRLTEGIWKALEIITIVVSIVAVIIGGPVGLLALGLSATLFFKALVDYRQGKINGLALGLAFLGMLFPSTKGLTTVAGLMRMFKSGASLGLRAGGRALSAGGRLMMQGGRLLMSPRTLAAMTGQGLLGLSKAVGHMFATGMPRIPGLLARTPGTLLGALRMGAGLARGAVRWGRFALRRDFFMTTAFVGGGMGRRLGVYAITNMGRAFDFALSALLPIRYAELAKFGFRGAWRMGILERGLGVKPSIGGALGKAAGSVAGDLAARTGRGLRTPDSARPFGDPGKLVVPGTSAWDDALDELTEFMPTPTAVARSTSASSLPRVPGIPSGRFSGAVDDLVEPGAFRGLDGLGSRFGPLLRGGGIDVADLGAGGLLPKQFRNTLDALDDLDELAGTGSAPRSVLLEQPQSAVTRLRDLDAFAGLDRTGTGLLKPLDELAELAPFSIDGKFGGLTTVQLRKILDGEIDLVDVAPDGVIMRIGKTDPVNVHVGLKDEVTIRVLDPDELGTGPLAGKFTGADSPASLGFKLDEVARLLPDRPGELGRARELLGLGPLKTDLATKTVTAQTGFPPLTLREIITGGAVGKTGAERFQAWVRAQNAAVDLDTAGQKLAQVADLPEVPPLHRAEAELDLSAAELKFNQARLDFDRLGMNLNTVRQNITVMMARLDGPAAHLPTGELRLLDDLAQPTGRWITMEPGEQVTYVLRTDAGIVRDVRVEMVDGHFTVTAPDGTVTRFGPDGAPVRPATGDRVVGPLNSIPEHSLLDGAATGLPRIELPGTDALAVARAADTALPADLSVTRLTDFQDVPLSGVGDLAGLEFRIGAGTAADGVPGTFRLDVTQSVPAPHGAGPRPRFTVERLDSGAFRVTDPAGTTRWEFSAGGEFLARETALVDNGLGLPSGLWLRSTATTTTDGLTSRIVGLVGPRGVTDSFPLTAIDRTLQDRLPGGLTLTDSVTGSRFHYDADLNLAFRDLPARDGSGFLRFTEGAPDVPPVRLDDLAGSSGLDDLAGIFQRTLDEASGGTRPLSDGTDLSLGAAPSLSGLDEAAALRLSDAVREHGDQWLTRLSPDDLPDIDLRAVRRVLDDHWTGLLERTPGIHLTGADDLADLEIRVVRVPSTESAAGSFRLELLDRAPAADGTVRGADFTVERLPGDGFAITDPTGNTTWTFAQDGSFLGREAVLTGEGLPSGLRVSATHNEAHGFTQVDLIGPDSAVRSLRATAPEGALAGRLPGGFTLTDTVTGSRFHFDRTGALVFRDLPARDGSGFLRFTEGARNAQPTRLVDPLSERFPLSSIPEEDLLDDGLTDISELFERTLDEASGIRPRPEDAAAADMSSISGAMEFLRVAPDSHAIQNLDLLRVQQLAGDATDSLNKFPGLRPELLQDQLRHMTAQAHEGIRQGAATVMEKYQNLPLATRLEDIRDGSSRVFGDFTVTPTPHGGRGGSRFTVTHTPTDLTTGFGPNRELLYQEVFVRGGPAELDGSKLGLTGRAAEGGWAPDSFQLVGTHVADDAFTFTRLDPNMPSELRGGFTLTDAAGTTKWHYGPEGTLALRDVQLAGERGAFRFEAGAPDGVPQVLDTSGRLSLALRAERLDDGRIALIHTGPGTAPLERTVFDASGGKLLEETVAIRGKGGKPTGSYWTIDHVTGKGVRVNGDHTPFTGRFDTAKLESSPTGQFKLTGKEPGKVTLFEREVLKNGNTLHIARDRFGHARWTEFDDAGTRVRSGERIGDPDQRTYHDVPDGSWRLLNTSDVRTYHKAIDGGLVRAEKGADGHWTWQRFDKNGVEALSGTRHWSANHVAFKDTFLDSATGLETVAQRRGQTWPFGGLHGSRMYQEHSLLPGHAPAGTRIDPGTYVGQGAMNAQIESLETLADGGSLLVKRFADQRPPAFMWKGAAGRNPFDNFFGDLFAGDSLNRVSHWTQTAADGTTVTGVRLNPSASNWVDVDQFGRVVRESRKLDDGSVIEIGRSAEDATRWAPLPEYREGAPYELHWRNTTTGETGTRHADGLGQWRDVFTDRAGVERVRLRSEGAGTREYLFEAPTLRDLARNDRTGVWVDRNSLLHVTGRRDLVGDVFVESSGSPYRTSWTWKTYDSANPATVLDEGIRKQNRGSLYSRTWDDSFVDLDGLGNVVRERNATDVGASWVDAVRQPDGTYKWTKIAADGTVHSGGVRVYDDVAKGRWRDLIDDQVVRSRDGGRVREYAYEIETPRPSAAPAGELTRATTLRDMLDQSARHFEPPRTVRVDREAWKEYDVGKVFRERVKVDGDPVRYREVDKQWGQWREYQNGHLVEQRVFDGRVYRTDPFGRLSMSGPAVIPHHLGGVLPRVGGDVGLPGDRAWQLIGREFDYRGAEIEAMGYLREVQDPWHGLFQGVRNGESLEMPVWQRELRGFLTSFSTGFVTDFTANLLITELTNNANLKVEDVFKALLSGTVGGTFSGGLNTLYNRTGLGYFKTSMGARDWGGHPKQSLANNTDDWVTDWAAFEKPTRWRNATYANTVGLATGALSGFVSNAISAAVFGVNGNQVQGLDALRAGMWGAAGSLFGGVSTGLARNAWHLATGARVFHKGGLGELGMNWVESALSRYIAFQIAQADSQNGSHLPSPGRAFPKPATTPAPPPPPPAPVPRPPAPQASAAEPSAPFEGLELP
ncbi:hypothetical protein [Streptomyces sp. AC550_RSS872]|uniref:hypothetical protein n=1 Tax=Streptomyces sp. AC550_RSS872 TaxID=2823689 RepID=UPI001C26CB1E|nr:hypothetical protein [Streptomyces sp. AC550_RSS872]